MKPSFMPPIYEPPHDPKSWLLHAAGGRDPDEGWRSASAGQLDGFPDPSVLALPPAGWGLGALTAPPGTFGGRILPKNVALDDGTIYLLDCDTLHLKYFDRCACHFRTVACLGGSSSVETDPCTEGFVVDDDDLRRLSSPEGIAISRGNLFIADSRARRLTVFTLYGLVLRGVWHPPSSEGFLPWQPTDVAVDSFGRVYVADPANGCIHRFSRLGAWQTCFSGMGALQRIAIDCHGRILILTGSEERPLRIVDRDGREVPMPTSVAKIVDGLARTPVSVDVDGNLHLAAWCQEPDPSGAAFDPFGNPVPGLLPPASRYQTEVDLYFGPLDSRIYRCQWHRIEMFGSVPRGGSVEFSTATSGSVAPLELIESQGWDACGTASTVPNRRWEGLVRSDQGRFLWLRARLRGNGSVTPAIEAIKVEYPRVSLRRYLPSVYDQDPIGADFTDRFLAIFDATFRGIERYADELPRFFDPDSAPTERRSLGDIDFLTWLGQWIGLTLDGQLPEKTRRRLLKSAARLHHTRGTRPALREQLLIALGIDEVVERFEGSRSASRCTPGLDDCVTPCGPEVGWQAPELILEHYQLRRWLHVGKGRLSSESMLWGQQIANRSRLDGNARVGGTQLKTSQDPLRDPFYHSAHKFTVFVPGCYGKSPRARTSLLRLIDMSKPAHTQYQVEYVEPRFRIGFQSMIGLDAVVGRYPEGVVLSETHLDRSTVLGRGLPASGPQMEIGRASQLGTSTRLT